MRSHSAIIPASMIPDTVAYKGFPAASFAVCLTLAIVAGSNRVVIACLFPFRRSGMAVLSASSAGSWGAIR